MTPSELGNPEPSDISGYSGSLRNPCPICTYSSVNDSFILRNYSVVGMASLDIGFGCCATCGHIYQHISASEKTLLDYYTRFSNYTQQQRELSPGPMSQRFLSLARDFHPDPAVMLEIGCATGRHLSHFRDKGWEVWGCDPSPAACLKAKELYNLNIDCESGQINLGGHRNLDLILCSGVLEHLIYPADMLFAAHAALRNNGLLMFEVPLAAFSKLLPPGWFAFEHLQYFSLNSITNLLNLCSFELLEARISMKGFMYPCVSGVARKTIHERKGSFQPEAGLEFFKQYTQRNNEIWQISKGYIDRVPEPFYLWGAGIHTSELLSRFPEIIIETDGIIDSDEQKQGQQLAGVPVISPADIPASAHVIISSYAQQKEIYDDWIAEPGRDRFHIHTLYNSR